jgi:deoxyribodipyrimidine photolyase-related protein
MAQFYKNQRKKFDILMDNGSPAGGKWSFDDENRKALPKNLSIPTLNPSPSNEQVEKAREYIQENFADNPGETEPFIYPIDFDSSRSWLQDFLKNRLANFGSYEDAIHSNEVFLFHSVLTPMLNIGLLTPESVLDELENFVQSNEVPLNAHEGFVRQVIGWREYMRGVYHAEGVFQRTNNHFDHKRKIPQAFYTGNTGIPPIDETIKRLLRTGYNHHIERLMILGNFMLLCEFDPDEIYRWFMELYIDAYDWVMVPNVYGMTQYSDGGRITTKPYISGSNYVLKMSNYSKGEWCKIWNALYWYFIFKRREEFQKNARMGMMIRILDKMNPDTLEDHIQIAEHYLASLD